MEEFIDALETEKDHLEKIIKVVTSGGKFLRLPYQKKSRSICNPSVWSICLVASLALAEIACISSAVKDSRKSLKDFIKTPPFYWNFD